MPIQNLSQRRQKAGCGNYKNMKELLKNLLAKKDLEPNELDTMAQECGYDDFNAFCEYADDRWNWHIDELCGDDKLPYVDFLKDELAGQL